MPMDYEFSTGLELLELCSKTGLSIAHVMLAREVNISQADEDALYQRMLKALKVMQDAVDKGLGEKQQSRSGMVKGDAVTLWQHTLQGESLCGQQLNHAIAAAMAVVEVNAAMGLICAAPTAGASGILPGTLIPLARRLKLSDRQQADALFTAAAVGALIAANASVSGAEGGCQAETGSAAAMAAAALVELSGGSPEQALSAASMALMNVMGLICDPVAGLVECPCIKRNALGSANAMLSADMALAGIGSIIPFDEVVEAMLRVGKALPDALRETAQGGIATSPTGQAIAKQVWGQE